MGMYGLDMTEPESTDHSEEQGSPPIPDLAPIITTAVTMMVPPVAALDPAARLAGHLAPHVKRGNVSPASAIVSLALALEHGWHL